MTTDGALELFKRAMIITAQVTGPILLAVLVVGLVVGVVQTATQVNEPSVGFITKVLAAALALVIGGPYALAKMIEYMRSMLSSIAEIVR